MVDEPLLSEHGITLFSGYTYEALEDLCRTQEKSRWVSEDIPFDEDTKQWLRLDDNTKKFIKHVLAFSIVSEQLVNANLLHRFLDEVTDPSSRRFYLFQAYMEDVHRRTYGLMLSSVILDRNELDVLSKPDINIPSIAGKVAWIKKWIDSDASFCQRLIAFAFIEGIFFSSLFCSFYWLKQRGTTLSGMIKANEYISRDEKLHCEFAITQLAYVKHRLTRSVIHEMMKEAVEIEESFVKDALPVALIGINQDTMIEYVRYIADRWLTSIPCVEGFAGPLFGVVKQPLEWMEAISVQSLSNFFDVQPTSYQDSKMGYSENDCKFTDDLSIFD